MVYAIKGINKGLGPGPALPLRREIDSWWSSSDVNDINQRSLFILSLARFQQEDFDLDTSYFQVAGIHGQPLRTWDQAQAEVEDSSTGHSFGYCVHGQELFMTWHRPYMLLYEQRLYENMCEVIQGFDESDRADLQKAADTWRLPYWDWAVKKPDWGHPGDPMTRLNVPQAFTQKTVPVRQPDGSIVDVSNPLYYFACPEGSTFAKYNVSGRILSSDDPRDWDWKDTTRTVKQPHVDDGTDLTFEQAYIKPGEQNLEKIASDLNSPPKAPNSFPDAVYRLLDIKYVTNYDIFCTTKQFEEKPPENYISLEGIHNAIHNWTGGYGHMGDPAVSAFDPIFWLHHCNIDRLGAIFQALYPDKWLAEDGEYGAKEPLYPFWKNSAGKTKDDYWNSDDCQDWTKLYYSYDDLQPWLPEYNPGGVFDQEKYQADIRSKLSQLYNTTALRVLELSENEPQASKVLAPLVQQSGFLPMSTWDDPKHVPEEFKPDPRAQRELIPDPVPFATWRAYDYIINVEYNRNELGGRPYVILFYFGDIPDSGPYYFEDMPQLISSVYNFATPPGQIGQDSRGCGNCQKQILRGERATGQCILTDRLVTMKEQSVDVNGDVLRSLDPSEVGPFLGRNLKWRVTSQFDETIPLDQMPNLKIHVACSDVEFNSDPSQFPNRGPYEVLYEVTDGRTGGLSQGESI